MEKTALIMAGGRGERFWPKSRMDMPKQFLSLTGDGKTMIQLTVERIRPLTGMENIYVATNESYRHLVREQLPQLPEENILCEPVGRNTAPCIGLGALHIQKKHGDALMMVLPSDHIIKYEPIFRQTLLDACAVAEAGENLVTLGIAPTHPETGYGYIKFDPSRTLGLAYAVDRFVEKPTLDRAREYLASQEYLWNSGMFIWKVSTILSNIRRWLPDLYAGLGTIRDALGTQEENRVLRAVFEDLTSISVDYGIMEKAAGIYTLAGPFGWDDVGSWLAISRIQKTNELGNVVSGNVISVSTKNCIIQGGGKLIAAVGLDNTVIVDTDDALLVCQKEHADQIKKVLEALKITNQYQYL